MRIFLLGASGGVGRHVLSQAAAAGHSVTLLSRRPVEVPAGDVTTIVDDVTRAGVFEDRVAGHDVVISSLGFRRAHPANPWSRLVSPPAFNSSTAAALIAAMEAQGVRRVVAVSAAGVGDSAAGLNGLMRFLVAKSNVGVAYRDLAVMEGLFAASTLDWCCPRPTRLTNGPVAPTTTIADFPTMAAISRASVAAWLLAWAEGTASPASRTPTITAA